VGSLKQYLEVAIRQHQERGQRLLERIPKPHKLPQEFYPLVSMSKREISAVLDSLEALVSNPTMLQAKHQPERLRRFRRAVKDLSLLETTCVTALERHGENDELLSQMIAQITREIAYPLLPPMVTSLSQDYFHIYPYFNLLFVPLTEGDFLLHLPDLYHELGHPLVTERHDPSVRPFQMRLLEMLDAISDYLTKERQKENRGRGGPKQFTSYFQVWEKSWLDWAVEFFCDLYAVYTIGPAFGWSHLHLYMKRGDKPYHVPLFGSSSHPADHARMQTILYGLKLADFGEQAEKIESQWNTLLNMSGATPEPEFQRCFPDEVLELFAQKVYEATLDLNCQIVTPQTNHPVYSLLNEAWDVFWAQPSGYIEWERIARQRLREMCSGKIRT